MFAGPAFVIVVAALLGGVDLGPPLEEGAVRRALEVVPGYPRGLVAEQPLRPAHEPVAHVRLL